MSRIFKELGWFFRKEWYKFLLVLIFTLILTYAVTLPPNYIGNIIDRIVQKDLTKQTAVKLCISMAAASIIIYVTGLIKERCAGKLYHELYYQLKKRFIINIFKQDGDFFEDYHPGDLMNRATGDTWMISHVSTYLLFNFIDTIMMLIISFILMVRLNLSLTLFSIIPLPLITALVMYLRPKIVDNWKQVRVKVSHLNNIAMESVNHVKLVRGFVKEKDDEAKLSANATDVFYTERKAVSMQALFIPSFRMITLISQGIALGYGAYLITHQLDFTVGNLITFNLYLHMFANPLFRLGNQITRFAQSHVSFDRLNEVMDNEPTIIDKPKAIELDGVETIEFRNLSFRYPDDKNYTIEDINLMLRRGETLGIVGKTGSGKTTLVKQLLRSYPITAGSIYINNQIISDYKKESIRRNIAYVPQEHSLFSRTVLENLMLGKSDKTALSLDEAIRLADFEKDLPFLENGLETIVGEAGVTLSGGQKQRLSIARAFLKNADILIFDDSLSAVDGMTEKNIIENLKEYRKDRTNIICSHRLSVIENSDKIIVLDRGKIVEQGTHQELMNNRKWYYEQYLMQQMEVEDET
ncbi:MAG: ABC transporter ATP-binding protein/permease [Bacilli bacterium]|nr:ABC transporter ATP-binding protein/permease [Bacilli bacterium]MDD4077742.1 ABC transporter ATP-binding protein [Bacilli bacterium]MDD4388065.1 ABC transporter ATP-binding protein [Bacilli bacterium]